MSKLDPRWVRASAGYIGVVIVVVMVAWAGLLPGAGERSPGDSILGHPYRVSMAAVVLLLAIGLGALCAWIGSSAHSWMIGLAALLLGGIVTGGLLNLAPWILYPNDQYPVAFMWLLAGAPAGFLSWLAGSMLLGFGRTSAPKTV